MNNRNIAYFTMEVGIDPDMPTYSGGLGVLAGDTLKSCADMGIPTVGITLLNRKGYFYQRINKDGYQIEEENHWSVDDFMELQENEVVVHIEGREVKVKAWKYVYKGNEDKEIPIFFLDTDVDGNSEWDRRLTDYLYPGDKWYRLCQEIILGVGGVRMLESLGYSNIKKYHMNEGHAAFLTFELLREEIKKNNLELEEALKRVREKCVFTTHTPVPAGHDKFPLEFVEKALGDYLIDEISHLYMHNNEFNMTLLALNLSKYVNGVAGKHKEISKKMFPGYQIHSITNGVHSVTWTSPPFKNLFDKYIPGWRKDPFTLRNALRISTKEIWDAHIDAKKTLLHYVNREENCGMDKDIFTIGFARRMTAYKRAELLFSDLERLKDIARRRGRIQIILSGKAHRDDTQGKEIIHHLIKIRDELNAEDNGIEVAYLENYDIHVALYLVAGVDVWLNTPLRPMEASGTSGMKACHNGVPHFSVLDGWWLEGHVEGVTGWSIGKYPEGDEIEKPSDSVYDAQDLYNKLDNVLMPLYYNDKEKWAEVMRNAIAFNASFFNTTRMLQQYVTNAYFI